MNRITLEELQRVVPILAANNVTPNDLFDYFRIVAINKQKYELDATNPLYFLSYCTDEEVDRGWFNKKFDLREHVNKIMKEYPNATFVIERDMVDEIEEENIKNAKFIVVENIPNTIDLLFEYTKQGKKAKVVAVTGSVGKTTTVGLIESVLKTRYNTLRLYSKRITPIILKASVINFLNDDVEYIVLENGIYYHDHVKVLSGLLNPDIACMIDIDSCHLGIDKLNSLDYICAYKAEILRHAKVGIINGEDEYLNKLELCENSVEYNGEPLFPSKLEKIERIEPSKVELEGDSFIIDGNIKVRPFILSNLAKVQYLTAYNVGVSAGLTKEEIEKGLNEYTPVENRLNRQVAFGKEVVFDGDITTYERMKALSDIKYDSPYLIIRKAGCTERIDRIEDIVDHFDKFKRVFVFDDIEYLEELKNHPNVEVVSNHDFMQDLDGVIIYHYSGYYRVWPTFDDNNLKFYDREVYPILKMTKEEFKAIEEKKRRLESQGT